MNQPRYPKHQTGAVLFLAMIFLVLLTILALTASSSSIMQERMTGALRNSQLGLMGAETALRGGEEMLWMLNFNGGANPLPPCRGSSTTNCVYTVTPAGLVRPNVQSFRSATTWLDPATDGARAYDRNLDALTGTGITANLATQPRFLVEYLGPDLPPSSGGTGGGVLPVGGGGLTTRHFYRITARSQGGRGNVIRVAESVYSSLNLTNAGFNPGAPGAP
jgi:type IV pilus assembly protein PilX